MGRITGLLFCAAGVLGLAAGGFAEPAGQDAKAKVKPKPAPPQLKAAEPAQGLFGFGVIVDLPVVADDAMVQQLEQQYGAQLRLLYRSELYFMRLVTQPTKQQYDIIAADGDAVVKATLRKYAGAILGRANDQSDPRAFVAEAIGKSVRQTLSAEQSARYQKELDTRVAARRRVVVQNLVLAVDKALLLTAEQRSKLGEVLEGNWDHSWDNPQWLTITGQYYPAMPEAKILPILTDTQKTVWRGIPKGNVRFGFDFGVLPGIEIGDDVWGDDPAPALPHGPGLSKAEAKK